MLEQERKADEKERKALMRAMMLSGEPQSPAPGADAEESEEIVSVIAEDDDEPKIILPTHMRVDFWYDRSCLNKLLFLAYKALRVCFVSVWYYFFPFIALMSSYIVPRIMSGAPAEAAEIAEV